MNNLLTPAGVIVDEGLAILISMEAINHLLSHENELTASEVLRISPLARIREGAIPHGTVPFVWCLVRENDGSLRQEAHLVLSPDAGVVKQSAIKEVVRFVFHTVPEDAANEAMRLEARHLLISAT